MLRLLALAASLEQVFKLNIYEKILITRPIMPMGKDIGYLPGDKDEKVIDNWTLKLK
jgi:PhoH-like ATPase